jgi:hypothetical protein
VDIIGIGGDARFEFLFRRSFDSSPIGPALASRQRCADFLGRIARDIAFSSFQAFLTGAEYAIPAMR